MEDPHLYPLLPAVFLAASFLQVIFCGAERVFEFLKNAGLDKNIGTHRRGRRIQSLMQESGAVITVLKLSNWTFGVLAVGAVFGLALDLSAKLNVHPAVFFFGIAILLAGIQFFIREVWAARVAVRWGVSYIELLSLPLSVYYRTLRPAGRFVFKILSLLSKKIGLNGAGVSNQRILAIVEEGGEDSELEEDERAMIHSIIEFRDTEVHEVMVPRTDMVGIEEKADFQTLIKLIREKGHSRLPLYSEDVDNILGIIHIKDLLARGDLRNVEQEVDLKSLARRAYFVPENKRLDDLLKSFQQKKHHMAIVVDEYGGTAGLITMEDVIEEIVGDIQDEYDKELPLLRQIDENNYFVDAKIDLHELNESLHIDLPTEGDYESLAGFILSLTGYLPAEKECVRYEGYSFLIEEVDRNRIVGVKLTYNAGGETPEISAEEKQG